MTGQEDHGVHDTPVHGTREESVEEARAKLDAAPSSDAPMPAMRHTLPGTSIVVEHDGGIGAAEDTSILRPDNDAAPGESAGSG